MSKKIDFNALLDAGVHFGHQTRKWNPSMAPYIFAEKKGIHVIDLNKTAVKLEEACAALKQIAKSGKKIMFVATKKQAKAVVAEMVKPINMPFVVERWPGGMLTNFATIRKAIKKMNTIDKMAENGTLQTMAKRERLQIARQRAKLEKLLGSISDMTRLPAAIFVVDISKEHIALAEAKKLNIPVFGMVDTNSDPRKIAFPIPANDDATKSIAVIMEYVVDAVKEGLSERKSDKAAVQAEPAAEEVEETQEEKMEEAAVAESAEAEEKTAK